MGLPETFSRPMMVLCMITVVLFTYFVVSEREEALFSRLGRHLFAIQDQSKTNPKTKTKDLYDLIPSKDDKSISTRSNFYTQQSRINDSVRNDNDSVNQTRHDVTIPNLATTSAVSLLATTVIIPDFPNTTVASSETVPTLASKLSETVASSRSPLITEETTRPTSKSGVDGFDVYTEGCKIPHLDPFDPSIKHIIKIGPKHQICEGKERHVFATFPEDGEIQLETKVKEDLKVESCEAEVAIRSENSDDSISWGKPETFLSTAKYSVKGDVTRVRCNNTEGKSVVTDYIPMPIRSHQTQAQKEKLLQEVSIDKQRPNVIILGLDAVSRHNFVRQLPKTRKFLLKNLSAIEMMGYNKVADNTFVNLVPMLSGKYLGDLPWTSAMKNDPFDKQPLIWKNFTERGYWTFYAEDNPSISTFNYLKRGFSKQPTDHYYRTMALALRHSKWENTDSNCYGTKHEDEWVYEWFLNGLDAHKKDPKFALVWTNQWTHNYLNSAGYADGPTLKLLQAMQTGGHLDDTVLLFLSDHGQRWGAIRQTFIGRFEERMPFFYLVLPRHWRQKYPEIVKNVEQNAKRLTTTFDVYETLLELLDFRMYKKAERVSSSNTPIGKNGVPFRYSLFSDIPLTRNCTSATILPHWCVCQSQESVPTDFKVVKEVAKIIVNKVNDILKNNASICQQLSLFTIRSAFRTKTEEKLLRFEETIKDESPEAKLGERRPDSRNYIVTVETIPGGGVFEATVRVNENWEKTIDQKAKSKANSQDVSIEGFISRLNLYGNSSWCMDDAQLRFYCYCKYQLFT